MCGPASLAMTCNTGTCVIDCGFGQYRTQYTPSRLRRLGAYVCTCNIDRVQGQYRRIPARYCPCTRSILHLSYAYVRTEAVRAGIQPGIALVRGQYYIYRMRMCVLTPPPPHCTSHIQKETRDQFHTTLHFNYYFLTTVT